MYYNYCLGRDEQQIFTQYITYKQWHKILISKSQAMFLSTVFCMEVAKEKYIVIGMKRT